MVAGLEAAGRAEAVGKAVGSVGRSGSSIAVRHHNPSSHRSCPTRGSFCPTSPALVWPEGFWSLATAASTSSLQEPAQDPAVPSAAAVGARREFPAARPGLGACPLPAVTKRCHSLLQPGGDTLTRHCSWLTFLTASLGHHPEPQQGCRDPKLGYFGLSLALGEELHAQGEGAQTSYILSPLPPSPALRHGKKAPQTCSFVLRIVIYPSKTCRERAASPWAPLARPQHGR